jgi:hypothetical protein
VRVRLVSPAGFLLAAATIGVLYGAAHLLGLREDTAILSGTAPAGGDAGIGRGLIYVALHFAWVIGAPILVIGAGVFWGAERALRGRAARR